MTRQTLLAVWCIGLGSLLATGAATVVQARRPAPVVSRSPLGDTLPSLMMTTLDGKPVSLRERIGHKPALIYVFTSAECTGCSNLPLEFRVVRRELPQVEPILIGSGDAASAFAPSIHEMKLEASSLIDQDRTLIKALRVSSEPLVILTDSAGRILLVDPRSTSKASHYPMGEVIHGLRTLFASQSGK